MSSIGSGDRPRLERIEEEWWYVCRPALPLALPPALVGPGIKSGDSLGRFLEIPNDGSEWTEGVLMKLLGPGIDDEISSPYAAGIGSGEEGR